MHSNGLSLRKLATALGVSQPFLSQILAGKRPFPEALKKKVATLGAYQSLIGDKHITETPGDEGAGRTGKTPILRTKVGGNDRVRTYDLALMKNNRKCELDDSKVTYGYLSNGVAN